MKRTLHIGTGTSDSWGFQVYYCHPDRSFCVMVLHWYLYIESGY